MRKISPHAKWFQNKMVMANNRSRRRLLKKVLPVGKRSIIASHKYTKTDQIRLVLCVRCFGKAGKLLLYSCAWRLCQPRKPLLSLPAHQGFTPAHAWAQVAALTHHIKKQQGLMRPKSLWGLIDGSSAAAQLQPKTDHQGNQNTLILLMEVEFKKNEV